MLLVILKKKKKKKILYQKVIEEMFPPQILSLVCVYIFPASGV